MLAIPMIPLQITLPWIISRYVSGYYYSFYSFLWAIDLYVAMFIL